MYFPPGFHVLHALGLLVCATLLTASLSIYHWWANGCRQGLEDHPKAGNTGAMPWLDRHFHVRIACSKFDTVKVLNVKVLFLCISRLHIKYTKFAPFENSRYTVDAARLQPAFHPVFHASWWRTGSKANMLNCSLHFCLFPFPFPSSFPFWLGVYLGAVPTSSYCRSSTGGREAPFVPCV